MMILLLFALISSVYCSSKLPTIKSFVGEDPVDVLKLAKGYCINLRSREDRWNNFHLHSEKSGLSIERKIAVEGSSIDVMSDERISIETKRRIKLKPQRATDQELTGTGALGCFLSHYDLWDEFLKSEAKYLLVFEDDAQIPEDLFEIVNHIGSMPAGWGVWLLGARLWVTNPIEVPNSNGLWHSVSEFHQTHAMVVTREAAATLLANAFPIEVQVDGYMGFMSELQKVKIVFNSALHIGVSWMLAISSDIPHSPTTVSLQLTILLCMIVACIVSFVTLVVYRTKLISKGFTLPPLGLEMVVNKAFFYFCCICTCGFVRRKDIVTNPTLFTIAKVARRQSMEAIKMDV
jgi:GR25 family glycosyltransferase involved in LPS biosynthesis